MDVKEVGVSRRQALRAGAYVAGAAWVVPTLAVIGASPAHADSASGGVPTTPPTTPGTPVTPPTTTTTTTTPPSVLPTTKTRPPQVLGTQLTKPPNDPGTVVEASGLSRLPRTGTEVAGISLLGAGLVAGGLAARAAARDKGDEAAEDASQS